MSDSYRRQFRLFTYRRPERWETIKRAAVVAGTVGALALGARKNRKLANLALDRTQRLVRNRGILRYMPIASLSHGRQRVHTIRKLTALVGEQRQLRRALSVRSNRFRNAAKIVGATGLGYVGMPYARKRGIHNNLKWQQKQWRA